MSSGTVTGRPLIITGMPHSAISPVPLALFEAGLFLGDKLNGSSAPSFRPDLEDADIALFHEDLLAANGTSWHTRDLVDQAVVPGEHVGRGEELLREKFGDRAVWGWTDRRAVLFLDYWDSLLPKANWLFVYQRPAHVVWSLIAGCALLDHSNVPIRQAIVGLRLWQQFNTRILAFVRQNRDRCLLLRAVDDYTAAGEALLNATLIERWGYDLKPIDFSEAYQPYLWKKRAPRWVRSLERGYFPARRLLAGLERLRGNLHSQYLGAGSRAELQPSSTAPEGLVRQPAICIAAGNVKRVYSQTFIHAHLHRLPAQVRFLHEEGGVFYTEDALPLRSAVERSLETLLKEFRIELDVFRNRSLRRFFRREAVEAVLAEFGPRGTLVAEACRAAGVPLIVHFHGYDAYQREVLEEYGDGYLRMFDAAAAVIAVSRDMERQLIRLGAPPEKVYFNPCGVDTAAFSGANPASCPPTFLYVGRFVDKKGPVLTLLAFKQVLEECPEARLIMIGDGPLWEACQQLARGTALEGSVKFVGARPHREIASAMRQVRAYVQHSTVTSDGNSEGTPVSVLEAGASGLPVVSTSHAGIADVVIHGETGFLVQEGDIEGMAAHMRDLAQNPDLAAALGCRARKHIIANFSMEASINRLWRIIKESIVDSEAAIRH